MKRRRERTSIDHSEGRRETKVGKKVESNFSSEVLTGIWLQRAIEGKKLGNGV